MSRAWRFFYLGFFSMIAFAYALEAFASDPVDTGAYCDETYPGRWRQTGGNNCFTSSSPAANPYAVHQCLRDAFMSQFGRHSPSWGATTCANQTNGVCTVLQRAFTFLTSTNQPSNSSVSATRVDTQCEPPPPPGCDTSLAGARFHRFTSSAEQLPRTICDTVSGCLATRQAVSVCMGGDCTAAYVVGTQDCALAPSAPEGASDAPGATDAEACVGEYCVGTQGAQCGYLNDSWTCVTATPRAGCQTTSGGDMLCGPDADAPPAPSTPTDRLARATPDGVIEGNVQNSQGQTTGSPVYNYYNSTTVNAAANSAETPPPGQSTSGGSTSGTGYGGTGSGEGTDEGEGGGEFGSPDDDPNILTATQAFWTRVNASPIAQAVAGISLDPGPGTCPSWSFTVFGQSFDISAGCDFMGDIAPWITLAFMAGWSLLAVRIVLDA